MRLSSKKALLQLILGVGLLVLPGVDSAMAQDGEVAAMDAVTVTGRNLEGKLSAELAEYGRQMLVIEGETIERLGFEDLGKALDVLVPGLYIHSGAYGDTPNAMMNGNNNALWLLDGVHLNGRVFGGSNLVTMAPNIVERIEVLYGGKGLLDGTEATAGVIHIITKQHYDRHFLFFLFIVLSLALVFYAHYCPNYTRHFRIFMS